MSADSPNTALRDAIDNAYRVFDRYAIDDDLTVCLCEVCMDEPTLAALLATPLRELRALHLAPSPLRCGLLPGNRSAIDLRRYCDAAGANVVTGEYAVGRNVRSDSTRTSGLSPRVARLMSAHSVSAMNAFHAACIVASSGQSTR